MSGEAATKWKIIPCSVQDEGTRTALCANSIRLHVDQGPLDEQVLVQLQDCSVLARRIRGNVELCWSHMVKDGEMKLRTTVGADSKVRYKSSALPVPGRIVMQMNVRWQDLSRVLVDRVSASSGGDLDLGLPAPGTPPQHSHSCAIRPKKRPRTSDVSVASSLSSCTPPSEKATRDLMESNEPQAINLALQQSIGGVEVGGSHNGVPLRRIGERLLERLRSPTPSPMKPASSSELSAPDGRNGCLLSIGFVEATNETGHVETGSGFLLGIEPDIMV